MLLGYMILKGKLGIPVASLSSDRREENGPAALYWENFQEGEQTTGKCPVSWVGPGGDLEA